MIVSASFSSKAQDRPPVVIAIEPVSAILNAFSTHDVVALGDFHHDLQLHVLRMQLLAHPHFSEVVQDIVFEFGTPQHQQLLDRYVDGDDVSPADLRGVSSEGMFNAVWDFSDVYRQFFAAVRQRNTTLPADRRLRIVLAESEPRTMEAEAEIIHQESVAKGRKALLVIGAMHFPRKPIYMPVSDREFAEFMFNHPLSVSTVTHLEAAGVRVFSIYPQSADVLATILPGIAQGRAPTLTLLAGTFLGAEPFATFAPRDTLVFVPDADGDGGHQESVLPDPARSGSMQEQFDALLLLAPSENQTAIR